MRSLSLLAACCMALTGCASKIKPFDADISIEQGQKYACEVDGPSKDQRIKVELVGASDPVSVFVLLSKDLTDKVEDDLVNASVPGWKKPSEIIEYKTKMKDGSFEVAIPAKQPFKVLIDNSNPRTTKLKLKINSL